MNSRRITLIVPGDPDQPTGGYRYDARVAAEMRELGWHVDVVGLAGSFPDVDQSARAAMDAALQALPEGSVTVIDGLALGGLPDVVQRHAGRLALVGLIHHPLADETGLAPALRERLERSEARALAACRRIVTTSEFTARRLLDFGVIRNRVRVVPPGVDSAASASGTDSVGQRLLCVGSLVPRKGQDLLIEALAGLREFDWRLELVGDADRDPAFTRLLRAKTTENGLDERIALRGVQDPATLDHTYRSADLLVVPSHYEGYGMVVTEGLARALPIIATTGGALADTVPAAAALRVAPGDAESLAAALRRWFSSPALRAEKRAAAERLRCSLPGWAVTGRRFADALDLAARETAS